jgi:hypothetical protein
MKELPEEMPSREVEIYSIENLGTRQIKGSDLINEILSKINLVKGDFRQKEITARWSSISQEVSDIYDALLQGFSDFKGAKKTMDDIVGAFKEAKRQMAEEVKNQYRNKNNKGKPKEQKPKEQKPKEQKPPTDKKGKKDTPDRIKELADMIKAKKATESLSMTDYDKAEIELLHLLYTSTPLADIEAAYNNLTSSTNGKAILDEYLKTIDNSIQEYYAGTTNATLRDTLSKNGIPLSIVGDVATLIESAHKDLKSLLREKVYQANAKKITKIVIDKAKQLITDKLKDISNYREK